MSKPLEYLDIIFEIFVLLGQAPKTRRVRKTLIIAIDHVFEPMNMDNRPSRRKPFYPKKLRKGDCIWHTINIFLGWIVDTISMTIHLPPHRVERLWEILCIIPKYQRSTFMKKCYTVLGKL